MDNTHLISILPANLIRKGTYLLVDDVVCKVDNYHTAKPGKHGAAKMLIQTYEVISGKQKDVSISTKDKVDIPIITRKEYTLMSVDENEYLQLLNDKGEMVDDIKLNENNELCERLMNEWNNKLDDQEFVVTVMHFMNQTFVDDFKVKKYE